MTNSIFRFLVGPTNEIVSDMRLVLNIASQYLNTLPVFRPQTAISAEHYQIIIGQTLLCGTLIEISNNLDSKTDSSSINAAKQMVSYIKLLEEQKISDCCVIFGVSWFIYLSRLVF
jgi:hypothetical protein